MRKLLALTVLPICATLLPAQTVLDFEGLQDYEAVQEFYNGGTGGNGSSGTDYGISFSSNAQALIDRDAGGGGNFGNEPTPDTILFFLQGETTVMDVSAGFDTGFSFYYTNTNDAGFVNVYDGLGGTGNLLASLNLAAVGYGTGDPNPTNGANSIWTAVGVSFAGVAKSVDFGGSANYIGFDNVTLGSDTPIINEVPEPAAIGMVLAPLGIGLILFNRRRKQKKATT